MVAHELDPELAAAVMGAVTVRVAVDVAFLVDVVVAVGAVLKIDTEIIGQVAGRTMKRIHILMESPPYSWRSGGRSRSGAPFDEESWPQPYSRSGAWSWTWSSTGARLDIWMRSRSGARSVQVSRSAESYLSSVAGR